MHGPNRNVRPDLRGPDGAATVDPSKAKVGPDYDPAAARGVTPPPPPITAERYDDGVPVVFNKAEVGEGFVPANVRIVITLPLAPGVSDEEAEKGGHAVLAFLAEALRHAGAPGTTHLEAAVGYSDVLADLRALPETPEVTP